MIDDTIRPALEALAQPERIEPMESYMRDQFDYLGVTAKDRRAATKPTLRAAKTADPDELLAFAEWCWNEPEREFQYVAMDALRAGAPNLRAGDLDAVRGFITTKSWWDTVDSLAAWTVGPLVRRHDLATTMDEWIVDDHLWVARSAILHQLGYKDATDADRLFDYALEQAAHQDFFIRKAIGWALRQYARVDPHAVSAFVRDNDDVLSPLTKREATKRLK